MICGMWTIRTYIQTQFSIEHTSVGLAHTQLITGNVQELPPVMVQCLVYTIISETKQGTDIAVLCLPTKLGRL